MIDEAIKIAKRSTHAKHQTGCVIVDRQKTPILISNGWSHKGNWDYGTGLYSVHAEIHALIRARPKNLHGCVAIIATIARKSGSVTNAAPCLTCAMALIASGIETVYYTVWTQEIRLMYLPDAIESANLKVYRTRNKANGE